MGVRINWLKRLGLSQLKTWSDVNFFSFPEVARGPRKFVHFSLRPSSQISFSRFVLYPVRRMNKIQKKTVKISLSLRCCVLLLFYFVFRLFAYASTPNCVGVHLIICGCVKNKIIFKSVCRETLTGRDVHFVVCERNKFFVICWKFCVWEFPHPPWKSKVPPRKWFATC